MALQVIKGIIEVLLALQLIKGIMEVLLALQVIKGIIGGNIGITQNEKSLQKFFLIPPDFTTIVNELEWIEVEQANLTGGKLANEEYINISIGMGIHLEIGMIS